MLNVNFVPEDYVQNTESRRVNYMYIVLFAVVMAALGGVFGMVKIRQHAVAARESQIDAELARKQEDIKKVEEIQKKTTLMMKTALTTAELIEPVPRSVLLASLTNNLPIGMSLVRLELLQKQINKPSSSASATKFDKAKATNAKTAPAEQLSPEKLIETNIAIECVAPSDIQVAAYIEKLSSLTLVQNVALVESKEEKGKESTLRHFKLTAKICPGIVLTSNDIRTITVDPEELDNRFVR